MLTDSGGFQVMSLAELRKVSESAVTFARISMAPRSRLSPERSIEVQRLLGSDIAMQMDECVRRKPSVAISSGRCNCRCAGPSAANAFRTAPDGYMLFGIAQGGDLPELRRASARGMI